MAGTNAIKAVAGVNATTLFQGFCKVRGWALHNGSGAYLVCMNLYDLARLPLVGIDVPKYKILVPYAPTNGQGTNFAIENGIILPFYNGLSYSIVKSTTANSADLNSTAVLLDDLNGVLDWSVRTD